MILLLHIIIALSSLVYITCLYIRPSRRKLHVSYGLMTATLASGTYLAISTHAPLVSSCTTGVIYLGVMSTGTLAAIKKVNQRK